LFLVRDILDGNNLGNQPRLTRTAALDEAANSVAAKHCDGRRWKRYILVSPLFYSSNGKSGIDNVLASFAG
jgi:hypothetical protein